VVEISNIERNKSGLNKETEEKETQFVNKEPNIEKKDIKADDIVKIEEELKKKERKTLVSVTMKRRWQPRKSSWDSLMR